MRIAFAFATALSLAPYQCRHDPDPNLRREDTAGDALWDLAQDFDARGKPEAARDARRYLVEHYPSNRHAAEARALIGAATRVDGGGD
jgi:Tfp pilus assembly protein PilF